MRGPPLSYIPPQAHTLLKYAAPWTYERVGRYSHGYITSYKLNFSSSPLFNLLQYFLQNSFLKCPRVKSVCEDFLSTLFPQNYFWLKVFCFMFFWLENWKHKYAYGLRKNSVTMCDQWNIILSSTPCLQKQLRCAHVVSADVGCIFVNVKFPRCIHLVYFTAKENVS